jgi:DNA-binding NarL/FixJ family response regulator
MYTDSELADEALRGGAAGFVLKQSAVEELMTAIDRSIAGPRVSVPRGGGWTRTHPEIYGEAACQC